MRSEVNPSTSTTQSNLGKAEKVPGLPEGPSLFLATTEEGEIVYCPSSEYYSGARRVNVIIDGLPYQSGQPVFEPTVLQIRDAASSTSTRTPSREVFVADAGGHHDHETPSQVSDDSKTIADEDVLVRDARQRKNQARSERRRRAQERYRTAGGRNLEPAFRDVDGVPIANNPEANIYGALLQINNEPETPANRRVKIILQEAIVQTRALNTRPSMMADQDHTSTRNQGGHSRGDRDRRMG
jgi:hypothetical protein